MSNVTIACTARALPREEIERRLWANIENLSNMSLIADECLEDAEAPRLTLVCCDHAAA